MQALKYIHVLAGFLALSSGLVPMFAKKGGKYHRIFGQIYWYSVMVVVTSALYMSFIPEINYFLLCVSVFSAYLALTGIRYLKIKQNNFKVSFIDKFLFVFSFFLSVLMILFALFLMLFKSIPPVSIIVLVFGLLLCLSSWGDTMRYVIPKKEVENNSKPKPLPLSWFFEHLSRMIGSYISVFTAFAVTNFKSFPMLVNWLVPTFIGLIAINLTARYYRKKFIAEAKKNALALVIVFVTYSASAQVYSGGRHTRHRFAQTTLGIALQSTNGGSGAYFNDKGELKRFNFSPQLYPRIHIGGTHFWGHAEFYLSFPLTQFLKSGNNEMNYIFNQSDIFGMKWYPWAISQHKFRPYIGISPTGTNYQQYNLNKNRKGAFVSHVTYPLLAGLTYTSRRQLIELGLTWNYQNKFNYYIDKTNTGAIHIPPATFLLSYRLMLEGTLFNEKPYEDGTTEKNLKSLEAKKKLSSFFIAIGPSSAFFIGQPTHNKNLPYIGNYTATNAFMEYGIGYFSYILYSHLFLTYRQNDATLAAYDTRQEFNRKALTIEAHRYLFDYNGFVPFLGLCASYENIQLAEYDNNEAQLLRNKEFISPGVVFGWDILPDKLQYLTLRTNLRYFPLLNANTSSDHSFSFQQLEFNFIQLVVYPQRYIHLRQLDNSHQEQ